MQNYSQINFCSSEYEDQVGTYKLQSLGPDQASITVNEIIKDPDETNGEEHVETESLVWWKNLTIVLTVSFILQLVGVTVALILI